jgi:hypothetical protein
MPRSASSARQGIPEHISVTLRKRLERHARDRWEEHGRHEIYEPSFLPSGAFEGTPEEAFDCAAGVYLIA